ncbi:hypothetical protein GWK47_032443 [Chionoecetes opilio]|uniref:Uncharacterized protein n=1 Tax=Chionoecetes opilio TaxID=41210 RepID=A0A8J4YIR8_CHIOP|nr:hypothetical protein GWK47_032443 [Chionoecetes opilio]
MRHPLHELVAGEGVLYLQGPSSGLTSASSPIQGTVGFMTRASRSRQMPRRELRPPSETKRDTLIRSVWPALFQHQTTPRERLQGMLELFIVMRVRTGDVPKVTFQANGLQCTAQAWMAACHLIGEKFTLFAAKIWGSSAPAVKLSSLRRSQFFDRMRLRDPLR